MQINVMKIVSLFGFAAAMLIALNGIADKDHLTAGFGIVMMTIEMIAFLRI